MTPSLLKLGAVALAYTSGTLAYQKEYKLADEFKPSNFFNKFDFKTFNSGNDPNGGHVLYQSQSQANDLGLISTHADHVYIGVDSVGAEAAGRKSVRIESKDSYNYGLFVIEFSHLPKQVCGAWPAFWLNGPSWPTTGEVDIYEGWNLNPQNKIVGHTGNPSDVGVCKIDTDLISSTLSFKNCHISAEEQPNNAGCAVDEKNGLFGNPNGGVWATEWTEESFKVWSWAPNQKPANLVSGKPDPSTWGIPSFTLSTASCDVKRTFKDMKMILNINFCGDAAGNLFNEGCAQSTKTTCDQYVSWNPSAFKDVFWKVKGIDIYQLETVTVSSTSISSTSTSSSATSTEVSSTTEPSSTETSTEATSTETSTEASSTEATSTEATSTEATSTEASVTETETSATETETATITTAPDVTSTTTADTSSTTATDDDNCSDDEEETSTAETVTATKTEATATETATETEATATETATETEGTETATKTEATATETASETEATATETATEIEGTETATKTEATATETASEIEATATETATETSTEVEEFTTSTIYATTTLTFTSCAPSVTNCPGRVVTSVIAIGTTVCPVTHTPVPSLSLTATVTASPQPTGVVTPLPSGWTTSTVYSTKIITVSSCAPTVPNCPGRVTTTLVPIGTTICPVGSGSTTAPGGGSPGGPGVPEIDTTLTTLLTATSTATVVVPPPVTPSVFVPPVVIVPSIVPTGATGGIKPPQVNGTFTAKPPTQPEASKPVPVVEGPVPSGKPPVTVGGAAKMTGSGLMAAVAGAFMVFML